MISLTQSAVDAVKSALSQAQTPGDGLRIKVEQGGCAGYKYSMGFEGAPTDGDLVLEQGGVRVFIDPPSQALVNGMQIDFVSSFESSGFVFQNPNATAQCGCGKSFA